MDDPEKSNFESLSNYLEEHIPNVYNITEVKALLQIIAEMEYIDEEIEQLKQVRKVAKEQAGNLLAEQLYNAIPDNDDQRLQFASILYWLAEGYLTANQILSPIGIHANHTSKQIYPFIVAYCNCGEQITVNNRSGL